MKERREHLKIYLTSGLQKMEEQITERQEQLMQKMGAMQKEIEGNMNARLRERVEKRLQLEEIEEKVNAKLVETKEKINAKLEESEKKIMV